MNSLNTFSTRIKTAAKTMAKLDEPLDHLKLNQGLILSRLDQQNLSPDLSTHEFKVFSQWGEDGIIQFLTRVVDIRHRTFIEFGVEDFMESNCRFLMVKDNWQGMVLDGSADNLARLRQSHFFWKHDLQATEAFITRDNINALLEGSGFDHDLGLLSIDIDGNDYHVLSAIEHYRPRILVCEFNAVFGGDRAISVPYDAAFVRGKAHHSNLYFGASLKAMTWAAEQKGYALVGINSPAVNAFYVRRDLLRAPLQEVTAEQAYRPSMMREGRDAQGVLTMVRGHERRKAIEGMPVLNVQTQQLERF